MVLADKTRFYDVFFMKYLVGLNAGDVEVSELEENVGTKCASRWWIICLRIQSMS